MSKCILWAGATSGSMGYGYRRINGKARYLHRLVWEEKNGPIPKGMKVCHTCDNPKCYNIEHLFLGTHQDNMADCQSKGRLNQGIRNHFCKLTEEQVVFIMARALTGRETLAQIGAHFGVAPGTIRFIHEGITWKHLFQ